MQYTANVVQFMLFSIQINLYNVHRLIWNHVNKSIYLHDRAEFKIPHKCHMYDQSPESLNYNKLP